MFQPGACIRLRLVELSAKTPNQSRSAESLRVADYAPLNLASLMNRFSLLAFLIAVVFSAGAAPLYDNGPPNLTGGSEMTHWRDANKFTLAADGILEGIRFWELEASAAFYHSVVWEIRALNSSNSPGAVLFSGTSANLTHLSTGRAAYGVYPEFADTFDIPPAELPAGTYWLVLHNGPLSYNVSRDIFWESAITTNTEPSLSDEAPFSNWWGSNGLASQLAFQIHGVAATARPRITSSGFNGRSFRVAFTTASGQDYRVEYKNLLTDPSWVTLSGAESVPGNGGVVQVADPDSNIRNLTRRFYRVVLLPEPTSAPAPLLFVSPSRAFLPLPGENAAPNSLLVLHPLAANK